MPKIGLGLLAVCFMLALAPKERMEPGRTAGNQAQVEMPVVALTFDDGPRADTTGRLLDELARREVPATFFLVGRRIPGNEAILCRMKTEGHQIGVHTYDHVRIPDLTQQEFNTQISKTRELLCEIVGEGEFWLRPPYGIVDETSKSWADGPLVLWSVDPEDWKDHDVQRIVDAVVEHTEDGDIILMHDIYQSSVDAAIQIVDALQQKGYCFLTVEQLMACKGIVPQAGCTFSGA